MAESLHEEQTPDTRSEPVQPVSYAMLDVALWKQLQEPSDVEAYLGAWLALLTRQVDAMATSVLIAGEVPDVGPFNEVVNWPAGTDAKEDLRTVAQTALKERKGVVQGEGGDRRLIAQPLVFAQGLFGVVAIAAPLSAPPTAKIFRQLQWGASWVEVLLQREEELRGSELRQRVSVAFDMLATMLEWPDFRQASSALVTELARELDCETVSFGLRKRGRMRVVAVSNAAIFGHRASLIREIAFAMDEAVDQESVILYPEPDNWEFRVTRAHEELARSHRIDTVLTIPLLAAGEIVGALCFERTARTFTPTDVNVCDAVAGIAGPILHERRIASRPLPFKIVTSLRDLVVGILGPSHFGAKLATVCLALGLLLVWTTNVEYSVTAPAHIEGTVQRSVVAPFNGYLSIQSARAGDVVKEGDILAILDDKDLDLERLRLETSLTQRNRELDRALADREIAQVRIIRAQVGQAEAQIRLVDEQLARTKIRAPFDGYVLEGDLSQSVGASIERGQTLFRISPLSKFRVLIEVDERDIGNLVVGQTGSLRLAAFPEQLIAYRVTTITPLAQQGNGRNFFRVEADIQDSRDDVRPGMEGIAKTDIGTRRLVWTLTHEIVNWARLLLWRVQP